MWQDLWEWRDKTLLFLIPKHLYASQELFARRLPAVSIIDWREEFLRTVQLEQKYLNLSVQTELDRIKTWSETKAQSILCINTEYALTRFTYNQLQMFWRGLWRDFPYSKSIIIYGVLDSPELLPDNLEQWKASNRVLSSQE